MTRRRIAGLVLVSVLALVAVLGAVRPESPFAERHTYYAVFDSAQGLGAIDRDVRVAGVKVGRMGEVVRRGDDVRIALELDEDITLHRDAQVAMRPHTLFEGSSFVDLTPGSPGAPVLDTGDTIPRTQTTNYVTLDEALRVLRPDIRRNLRTLARVGSRTLSGAGVDGIQNTLRSAPPLLEPVTRVTRAARGSGGDELTGAIRGLGRTVDAVEQQTDRLLPLARRTERTAAALTVDGGEPLDATLAATAPALLEMQRSAPALTAIVRRTRTLAGELTPQLPSVAAALRETTPVLRRTIPVAQAATPVVRDARYIASRLGQARPALQEMFKLIEPSLDKFDSLFEVFNTPTALGAPSGVAQLVGGAFTGLNASFRPYQTRQQNANAPGHQGRIGVYVDPPGLLGLTDSLGLPLGLGMTPRVNTSPECGRVAEVSDVAARTIKAIGGCQ